jgi:hypothetical protein
MMKHALIANNKIIEIISTEEMQLQGWQEVPDEARIGDVFDSSKAKREDNLRTELPPLEKLIVTLWEFIVSGDKTAFNELEAARQKILAKYPKQN